MVCLGIDTSNYTTSAALYFSQENTIIQAKKLLPVKSGEKGLRQSDAVFHHTAQLHSVIRHIFKNEIRPDCICASSAPCMQEGSYMPCFLVGTNTAESISTVCGVPFCTTSHQHGHIVAALYSCGRLDLLEKPFIAFHLSGGTTQALLVEPDSKELMKCTVVAQSLDLKAGQAVDRVGLMLGLDFPCGPMLDKFAQNSDAEYKIRTYMKDGNCSLSGIENQCRKMIENGAKKEDVARYCIDSICASLEKMIEYLLEKYGELPLVFSGGVMSNTIIHEKISRLFPAHFASAEFSCDNAAGVAIIGYLKNKQ